MSDAALQVARTGAVLRRRVRASPVLAEQMLVAAAQVAAGVGNLVFALVAARLLAPGEFAALAVFLALYLLVHVPASSLSAGSALEPALAVLGRPRALRYGLGAALVLAAASVPLSDLLNVPLALLLVLVGGVPLAPWLALERGRLYGQASHARAAASLAVEPALRLGLGIPLLLSTGSVGGAAAVVVGGWAALAITRPGLPRMRARAAAAVAAPIPSTDGRGAILATAAFLGLALLQNQDVVFANGLLSAGEAGRFAVLSTLGGVAAFATTTVPLVLLPRSGGDERGALGVALAVAGLLGAAAVATVALVPSQLVGAAFGARYASIGALVVPYVGAMALFGVARVLIAERCARGGGRSIVVLVALVALAQAAAIVLLGHDGATIASITLAAMTTLTLAAGAPTLLRPRQRASPLPTEPETPAQQPVTRSTWLRPWIGLTAIVAAGMGLRLLATRGIWLDEATAITQAQMPLHKMLDVLRTGDVHPPLHHLMLWVMSRTLGTGELAMRLPSLVAGGITIVMLHLLGQELYDRRAGMLAAAMGAIAPFLVWYSQEARMYALFMLFASVALYAQILAVRRGKLGYWGLYALASAALLWTQYFSVLFVAVQQLGFLGAAWRTRRAGLPVRRLALCWAGVLVLIAIAVSPLAPFAFDQFQNNQASGRGFNAPSNAGGGVAHLGRQPGVYVLLTNLVWSVWGYHSAVTMAAVTALWPVLMLGALLLLGRGRGTTTRFVAVCAILPALGMFAVGFAKPFLFEVRYFAASVPLLLVLLARAATGWARGTLATALAGMVLIGSLGVAFADQQLNRSNPRLYDFEGALKQIQRRSSAHDVLLYDPPYLSDLVRYYSPGLRYGPLSQGIPKHGDTKRVFLMASFLDNPQYARESARAVSQLDRRWHRAGSFRLPQVRVWIWQR